MKGKLKYLLFIAAMFVCGFMTAPNVFAATLHQENTQYYYDRFYPDGSEHSWYFKHYTMDNEVAYCIEPGVVEGVNYPQTNYSATGLPNSIKERLLLIGYYGYTYPGHNTEKYRMATQGMLWDTIIGIGDNTKFSTARYGNGTVVDISAERAEINRLIEHHYDKPSFNGEEYTLQVGESLTITDTNNLLGNYNISVTGANYSVDGNNLTITPTVNGNITVKLTKQMPYSSEYKIFTVEGKQNMMVPGSVDPVVASFKINSYLGSLEMVKADRDTEKAQGQATLKGAIYGIYNTDGIEVARITTDENGYAKSGNILSYGSYYLKEITPSNGYYLDSSKYDFDSKGQATVSMNVTEEVVTNYVSILKQYEYINGNTEFLTAEKNIKFEISYPDGNILTTITTDKNGYATFDLPFGVWKFHQVNSSPNYEKIYDFYVTVDYESEKEQYYNILNNKLAAYVEIVKKDAETGKIIKLADTSFKILNTDTNQYVSQYVGGKVLDTFTTDESGKTQTYLKLEAGNYKIVEIKTPKGYLINKDGVSFSIGDESNYKYTSYGLIVTVDFVDQAIKGQIEINKKGEKAVIENNSITYEEIPLNKVKFEIHASEDILSSDKTVLYYEKGALVDTITTNDEGYAISKKLPLGKYYVIEVETGSKYILDNTKHEIELKEKDNQTPIVYESVSKMNYLKKGSLEFTKTDLSTDEPLPNTLIEVYTENDEMIFSGRTDENGKITIKDIVVGKYYILEKEAPEGYTLNEEKMVFEILENGEVVKSTMKDKKITGSLDFTKLDFSTDETLPNTLIQIYNENDELVFEGRTDDNGKITIEELTYGKYYILEKEAPEGYELNTEKMWFEIREDGEIVKSVMKDHKIIQVPITDATDYKELIFSGVTLIIAGVGLVILSKKKNKGDSDEKK